MKLDQSIYNREYHAKKRAQGVITAQRLREILSYDPETGLFVYRTQRGRSRAGSKAGTVQGDGRININLEGRVYRAHRLAWLYMTGEWPAQEIDHKDTDPGNNRWVNLRNTSSTVNKQNIQKAPNGKIYSRLLGAHWCKQSRVWKSSIRVNKKRVYLGVFASEQEAHEAYIAAKRIVHEGCLI